MKLLKINLSVIAVAVAVLGSRPVKSFRPPGDDFYAIGEFHSSPEGSSIEFSSEWKHFSANERPVINHYTTIGMPSVDDMDVCKDLLIHTKHTCNREEIPVQGFDGSYIVCSSHSSGAQLWGEIQRNCFGGFAPHFKGKSRVPVCIISKQARCFQFDDGTTSECALEGGFLGMFDWEGRARKFVHKKSMEQEGKLALHKMVFTTDEGRVVQAGMGCMDPDTRECFYAFHFDCPNFGLFDKQLSGPIPCNVQLAAFAREIESFDSVQEYDDDENADGDITLASQHFAAGNLMDENGKPRPPEKQAFAFIVGHVIETEMKTNEITGKSFHWALVRTAGNAEIDVVIHPSLPGIADKPPKVGGVISGYFWLSGLVLLGDDDETKS